MIHLRALVVIVLVPMVMLSLSGCGSSSTYSAISQAASNASGPVRSVAIALSQEKSGRGLGSMTDTSVEDALKKVVDEDSGLASMSLTGPERTARDRVLAEVRVAEDALLAVDSKLTTNRAAAVDSRTELVAIATKLNSLSTKYEHR